MGFVLTSLNILVGTKIFLPTSERSVGVIRDVVSSLLLGGRLGSVGVGAVVTPLAETLTIPAVGT